MPEYRGTPVITKNTYKMMKYIYRHEEVTLQCLQNKFGKDISSTVFGLCNFQFLAYHNEEGKFTFDATSLRFDCSVLLSLSGQKYVEDRLSSFYRWLLPIVISFVSLVLSLIALLHSLRIF